MASLVILPCLWGCSQPPAERPRVDTIPTLSPEVDALLMAHVITPEESLSVRLLGTVGPSGAYSLKDVPVSISGDQVFIMPNVRQAKEGNFIQMVIPLDHTLKLALPLGTWNVQVLAKQGTLAETVVVQADAQRSPPSTRIELGDAAASEQISVRLRGECADGYVNRIEIRTIESGKAGAWQAAQEVSRQGGAIECMATLPRSTAEMILEARSIDGQGVADASPARLTLR